MSEEVESFDDDSMFSDLFKPGNNLLGYVLILTSLILWFEGNNLRSLNILLVIIAVFWLVVKLLAKTKLFSKKETNFEKPSITHQPYSNGIELGWDIALDLNQRDL